jgi:hypothetical protein
VCKGGLGCVLAKVGCVTEVGLVREGGVCHRTEGGTCKQRWGCVTKVGVYQGGGVTKRCRPSWLTKSALVHEPKCGVGVGDARSQPVSTAVPNAHGAQINTDKSVTCGTPLTLMPKPD